MILYRSNLVVYFALLIMASSAPFYWLTFYAGSMLYYATISAVLAIYIGLALMAPQTLVLKKPYIYLYILSISAYLFIGAMHDFAGKSSEMLRYALGFTIKYVVLVILVSCDRNYNFAKLYVSLTQILCALAFSTLFLILLGLWPFDYLSWPLPNKYIHNYLTTFSSSVRVVDGIQFPRMSSFLDEPGAFAMLIAFAILLNQLYVKSRRATAVLMICGYLTLSLAFLIFSVVFLLLTLKLSAKGLRNIAAVPLLFSLVYFFSDSAQSIIRSFIGRLEWDADRGTLAGDNRFADASVPDSIFFGDGLVGGRDSIIGEVFNIGLVGVFISYLPILVMIFVGLKRHCISRYIPFLVCSLLLLMQRPAIDKLYVFLPIWYSMHQLIYEKPKT